MTNFRYRWKNGSPPSRDQAARSDSLLDASQFDSEKDQKLAEQEARKYLNVPTQTQDADLSILPQAAPPDENNLL
ncbi:MAG: bromodomain-containing protein [Coleofasciculus sp. S288]|nr:bromodomain-containing protein [Coleofasciculus sp. S288]